MEEESAMYIHESLKKMRGMYAAQAPHIHLIVKTAKRVMNPWIDPFAHLVSAPLKIAGAVGGGGNVIIQGVANSAKDFEKLTKVDSIEKLQKHIQSNWDSTKKAYDDIYQGWGVSNADKIYDGFKHEEQVYNKTKGYKPKPPEVEYVSSCKELKKHGTPHFYNISGDKYWAVSRNGVHSHVLEKEKCEEEDTEETSENRKKTTPQEPRPPTRRIPSSPLNHFQKAVSRIRNHNGTDTVITKYEDGRKRSVRVE